jgi:hypothetical protein
MARPRGSLPRTRIYRAHIRSQARCPIDAAAAQTYWYVSEGGSGGSGDFDDGGDAGLDEAVEGYAKP